MEKISLTGGFEPPTFRLTAERSTDWATRAIKPSLLCSLIIRGLNPPPFQILITIIPSLNEIKPREYINFIHAKEDRPSTPQARQAHHQQVQLQAQAIPRFRALLALHPPLTRQKEFSIFAGGLRQTLPRQQEVTPHGLLILPQS